MSAREWIEILSIAVGGIVAIAGIVGGIMWLVKGHIAKISELHELKQEIEPLRAEAERADQLEIERDEAIREKKRVEIERDTEREKQKKIVEFARSNYKIATINYDVCQRLKEEWQKAREQATNSEAKAGGLETSLASATEKLECYAKQIEDVAKHDGKVWSAAITTNPPAFVPLAKRYQQRPTIISVLNLKGGVGKTTLTANLGGYLAHQREKWVLLLDLDHQRSLTQTLFTADQRKDAAKKGRTVQAALRVEESKPICEVAEQVQGEDFSRLWVVGNSDAEKGYGHTQNLDDREMDLLGEWLLNPTKCDIRYLLRGALHHSHEAQERYEYVLIDCPPRLTTACINALAASDFIIVPAQPEPVAATSVSHLLRRLRPLRDTGILPNLQVLVVGSMLSKSADKKAKEVKLLKEHTAAASELWKPGPVRLAKSTIDDSGYYSKYQRDFVDKGQVQLPAISVEAIRDEYTSLAKEIEQIGSEIRKEEECHVDESPNVARVPS